MPCQVAGGGDTGDDAGQERVLAGSALLYNPLTNRVTHAALGLEGSKPSVWLRLNMKPKRVKQKAGRGKSQNSSGMPERLT